MRLFYNGVNLGLVQVVEDSKVAEYDPTGQDYLWTRYRIAVEAIYTPDDQTFAAAYSTSRTVGNGQPDPTSNPVPSRNSSAVYTDRSLRHTLMQPRGVLIVDYNSDPDQKKTGDAVKQVWLESPPTTTGVYSGWDDHPDRMPCDLNNGPIPQEDTIVNAVGDGRTFFVRFVVETCLNDCRPDSRNEISNNPNRLPPPPLLSNRWTASMSYDPAGYATRTFTGLAIFRADLLRDAQNDGNPYWTPDAWRLAILPPVPKNAIRYVDEITPAPDGFSYKYVVRDVEQEVTFLDTPLKVVDGAVVPGHPRNVREISCEVFRQYQSVGTKEALPQFINTFQQAAWGTRESLSQFSDLIAPGVVAGIGLALGAAGTLNNLLPTYSEVVVCTVQGTRNATKAQLFRLAYSCAFGQLSSPMATSTLGELIAGIVLAPIPPQIPGYAQIQDVTAKSINSAFSIIPPATTLSLRYDAFKKKIQVTVAQEFGGLIDWGTGATAGGLKMVTTAPPEGVVGATWPQAVKSLAALGAPANIAVNLAKGAAAMVDVVQGLPTLDDAGTLIGTSLDGPGLDLPLAAPPMDPDNISPTSPMPGTPRPYSPPRQGTQLFNVIAANLLGECAIPAPYWDDPGNRQEPGDRSSSYRQNGKPPSP